MLLDIHRGRGLAVVALSGIISAVIVNGVTGALFDYRYYESHAWPKFGVLWLAGLLCTAAGAYLRKNPTKLRDRSWFPSESADHFFFIPVIYWGPVYFVAGIVYLIYVFRKGAI